MNYKRIHNEIIERAKQENRIKTPDGIYYERHHIIPKCLGGTNNKDNLVLLTGREHFLVHWLLAEIYNLDKLWMAFESMCILNNNQSKRYIPSSRIVELSKKKFSNIMKDRHVSKETCIKISNSKKGKISSFKGKKLSDDSKKKISLMKKNKTPHINTLAALLKANTGRIKTPEECLKLSKALKGKKKSEEYILKMKERLTGKSLPNNRSVLLLSYNYEILKEFSSKKEAATFLGIAESTLRRDCFKQNKNKGYILCYNYYPVKDNRSKDTIKNIYD